MQLRPRAPKRELFIDKFWYDNLPPDLLWHIGQVAASEAEVRYNLRTRVVYAFLIFLIVLQ